MEVLQNLGAPSGSLQSHMSNALTSAPGDDETTQRIGPASLMIPNRESQQNPQQEDVGVADEITAHSLLELQCMTDDSAVTTKSSMADLILGSGDSLSSIQDSNSLKHSTDLFAVGDSSQTLTHTDSEIPVESPIIEDSPQVNVKINNVVCTFSTRCHLNLRYLALNGENVEFKKAQGMLNMKLRDPSATASIWSSGKITVTGASSEDNCKIAARRIARKIQKLGFNVKFSSFRIVNVLGTCSLPFGILLTEFTNENIAKVQYEPELHPGATYQIKDIQATLKIFSTGSMTITAPKVENIQLAVQRVFPMVYQFKKPKPLKTESKDEAAQHSEEEEGSYHSSSEVEIVTDNSDLDLEPGEIPSTKSRSYSGSYRGFSRAAPLPHRRRVPQARLPATVTNAADYGSSSDDDDRDSDESMD